MTIPPTPNPSPTPRPLRAILWALFLTTILSHAIPDSLHLFSLSMSNLARGRFWTLLTHPFTTLPAPAFPLLLHLAFNLLLLWIFGIPLLNRISSRRFLLLFFGGALFSGLSASLVLLAFDSPIALAGATPPLLSLVTAWAVLQSEKVLTLPSAHIRPSWIFILIAGINILADLLERNWIELSANSSAVLYGYLFALISERARSNIRLLYPFERFVLRLLEKPSPTLPKIYDIQTGAPVLDDDAFMDAMLTQIATQGEESLTPAQKLRLHQISQKKRKNLGR